MAEQVTLTSDQEAIATHTRGPALVLAGAGSGKTATLIERAARLIESGEAVPSDLLMLTFSRKAAREMKVRLRQRLSKVDADGVRVDTFHGFGYQFMREHKTEFGLEDDERFAILSESDQKRMLTELCQNVSQSAGLDNKKLRKQITAMFKVWSKLKQDGVCPSDPGKALDRIMKAQASDSDRGGEAQRPPTSFETSGAQVLVEYERQKRTDRYLDFDDLLLLPARMMHRNPDLAHEISKWHPFLMVDESQDTNFVQYVMVRQIGSDHKNVMMVGDDDQSIYAFRGARVANVKRFAHDFGAQVMRLEQNFRSHPGIVEPANSLIQNNQARMPKEPYSEKPDGTPPIVNMADTDREMARDIVAHIQKRLDEGANHNDIAIVYRTNRMAQVLEPSLKREGIPYSVVGGMSFFERSEIQAVINCVRLAEKPDDWQALKALQPYIDRVGAKGMSELVNNMKEGSRNLLDLAFMKPEQIKDVGKAAERVQSFYNELLINTLVDADTMDPEQLTRRLVEWVKDGPMQLLEREKDEALRRKRHQNLEQLVEEVGTSGTEDFMDYLLQTPISDYQADEQKEKVTLSTIHRMKGLEFPHVIIAGMSDGLIPYDPAAIRGEGMSLQEGAGEDEDDGGRPEEERRLAYVALTRGQETVYIASAREYRFPGSDPVTLQPSRYVSEMGLSVEQVPSPELEGDRDGRVFAGLSMG